MYIYLCICICLFVFVFVFVFKILLIFILTLFPTYFSSSRSRCPLLIIILCRLEDLCLLYLLVVLVLEPWYCCTCVLLVGLVLVGCMLYLLLVLVLEPWIFVCCTCSCSSTSRLYCCTYSCSCNYRLYLLLYLSIVLLYLQPPFKW